MMHARGVANGNDYDWIDAGEVDEEIMERYNELAEMPLDEILNNM